VNFLVVLFPRLTISTSKFYAEYPVVDFCNSAMISPLLLIKQRLINFDFSFEFYIGVNLRDEKVNNTSEKLQIFSDCLDIYDNLIFLPIKCAIDFL
jgi:hypothetical protein